MSVVLQFDLLYFVSIFIPKKKDLSQLSSANLELILLGQSYQSNLCRSVRQWISQINKSARSWKHFHSENKSLLLILRFAHYKVFGLTFYEALKSIKVQGDCDIIPVMKVTQNEGLWKQHFAPLMGLNHALCGDYGYRRVTRAGKGGGSVQMFYNIDVL